MSENTNEIIVARELGYLRRSSEENSKNIDRFFVLLSEHMEGEERERRAINNKLSVMSIALVGAITVMVVQDSGMSGILGTILKTILPIF